MSDEILSFNTEQAAGYKVEGPETFDLVSEEHPILKKKLDNFDFANPPVNPEEFAATLAETCKLHRGLGLSANQCGFEHRVFVMGDGNDYVAFFNPEIIWSSDIPVHMVEGCLSFPFLALRVTRPETIRVKYQNYLGETKETSFSGLSARCFQHELDHMNGIVYTSRAKPLALQSGNQKRNKLMRRLRLR
jgi:peptide deformylase